MGAEVLLALWNMELLFHKKNTQKQKINKCPPRLYHVSGVGLTRYALGKFHEARIESKFPLLCIKKAFARVLTGGPNFFCIHGNPRFKWDLANATDATCIRRAIEQSLLASIKNLLDPRWNGEFITLAIHHPLRIQVLRFED